MFRPASVRLLLPPALFTIALANPFRPAKALSVDHPSETVAGTAPLLQAGIAPCRTVADGKRAAAGDRDQASRLRGRPGVEAGPTAAATESAGGGTTSADGAATPAVGASGSKADVVRCTR